MSHILEEHSPHAMWGMDLHTVSLKVKLPGRTCNLLACIWLIGGFVLLHTISSTSECLRSCD